MHLQFLLLADINCLRLISEGERMRIAVCVKQVPDTETKLKLKPDGSGIDTAGVKWVVNPYDEHAIEEALKIREANAGSTVFVFTVGPKARVGDVLRTALAMGADEGVLVDAPENIDNVLAAQALVAAFKKEGAFDLVLTGKLAIDDNASSVSQMIASELNIPHATVVSKLTVAGVNFTIEREAEGGTKEIVEMTGPAVIGANKGLNMPRYASLPGIMKAKKKVLKEYDFSALGVDATKSRVRYSNFKLPPEKPAAKILAGDLATQTTELTRLLREEAKVL
jgi:electron transfer flavoprotein beta subunit